MTPDIYNDKRFGINHKDISPNALNIISKLHKSGFKAYIVGGGIRDMIKGKKKILLLNIKFRIIPSKFINLDTHSIEDIF